MADKALLFEFEDLPGFPDHLRRGMVDYLTFFLVKTDFYKPIVPLIAECIEHSGENRIVDLCSGGGGPMIRVLKHLEDHLGEPVTITLTDKFPNTDAYKYMSLRSEGRITFEPRSVDASSVPQTLKGVRTCFSALHHFSDGGVKAILADATKRRCPVAFFDGGDKNLLTILGIALVHPVAFVLCTPFFKPFRFDRLLFTYLLPVIPFCTVWDGIVSILRLHDPRRLEELAREVDNSYTWKSGKKRHPLGFKISYLVGYPAK